MNQPYAKAINHGEGNFGALHILSKGEFAYMIDCASFTDAEIAAGLLNNRHSEDFLHDVAIATAAYTDGIALAIKMTGQSYDGAEPNAFDWEAFNAWLSGGGMIETRYAMVEWAKKDAELQAMVSEFFSYPGVWSYEVSEEVGAAAVRLFLSEGFDPRFEPGVDFNWQQVLDDECLKFVCRDADHNREEVIARILEVLPEWQRPPKPDLKQAAHNLANTVADGMDAVMLREMLYSLQRSHVDTNNDLKILIDAVLNKPSREITAVTTQLAEKYGVPTEE